MKILITNDDGIGAQGIHFLVESLKPFAQITVVAPDRVRSGASSQITVENPIRLILERETPHVSYYKCTGTPVDCVKLALQTLFPDQKPDYLFSGINHGRNDGICVVYSGTIGAVMEGTIAGIPSVALSTDAFSDSDFEVERRFVPILLSWLEKHPLEPSTFLNINFPQSQPKGVLFAPQTIGRFVDEFKPYEDPKGNKAYWMQGYQIDPYDKKGSDFHCLEDGYIAITPLQLDQTDYRYFEKNRLFLQEIEGWKP